MINDILRDSIIVCAKFTHSAKHLVYLYVEQLKITQIIEFQCIKLLNYLQKQRQLRLKTVYVINSTEINVNNLSRKIVQECKVIPVEIFQNVRLKFDNRIYIIV